MFKHIGASVYTLSTLVSFTGRNAARAHTKYNRFSHCHHYWWTPYSNNIITHVPIVIYCIYKPIDLAFIFGIVYYVFQSIYTHTSFFVCRYTIMLHTQQSCSRHSTYTSALHLSVQKKNELIANTTETKERQNTTKNNYNKMNIV